MKYAHAYHAGNFADVHKHVALLALLRALQRKDKGCLVLETHAGRGAYRSSGEGKRGIDRFGAEPSQAPELQEYAAAVAHYRKNLNDAQAYPGSPLLIAAALRPQDRAVFVEIQPAEAHALEQALANHAKTRVDNGDGFARLRAYLPPAERRGLTFIDPPYEETRQDINRVAKAVEEALRRFETGVIAAWYPIKEQKDAAAWLADLGPSLHRDALVSEIWLYPRDSRVGLNGSGLLIINPPHLVGDRMQAWLPELHARLDFERAGGWSVRALS